MTAIAIFSVVLFPGFYLAIWIGRRLERHTQAIAQQTALQSQAPRGDDFLREVIRWNDGVMGVPVERRMPSSERPQ